MKHIKLILCLSATVTMLFGCTNRYASEKSQQTNTQLVVQETTEQETTEAQKIITADDFKGYWNPVCIIENDIVNEQHYNDIPLDYIIRLYINDGDSKLYIGNTFEDKESADENSFLTANDFDWTYENGMLKMEFPDGRTILGKMKDDTLILTDGNALKIYFNKEMEFDNIDTDRFIRNMCGENVVIPSVENLFSKENKLAEEDILGKWECTYYSADGAALDNFFGIPLDEFFQLEVSKDKKAVVRIGGTDEDAEIIAYTWEINESGNILLYGDDGEFSALAVITDGEFCIEEGTDTTRYRKTDKFKNINWDNVEMDKTEND